ncbi:MFS transporter [Pseudomaricurvus alkylphenolicus]|jgi:fucose permease|uniref:MFS transporter n=1 Tax=Pseudomaricurvus alkylphenolicus TaxID=1306991 RepID=UPI001420DEFF|nr:MFS transporter [Pseudomaricurvus alkylphenolicus]NIB41531.1 MFS transporter [Pseudomaricurvus alkylphenolicus]
MTNTQHADQHNLLLIKGLTFLMFLMFAMTTDAVGVIIPEVIREFGLSMTAAGAFHYAPMIAIALSGVLFGFLADKLGRKTTILIGLILFAAACFLFVLGNSFEFFLGLLVVSGAAIGIFKTGALALIGDISSSTRQHTSTMNAVEGFFGVGAIIGPAVVTYLLAAGYSWKYLYAIAGGICLLLVVSALAVRYPQTKTVDSEPVSLKHTLTMMKNPYALGFSLAIALYVATEVAIYVWMPTLLADYNGSAVWFATYALTIFFILRAGGRFLGVWILSRYSWTMVMMVFSLIIFLCYLGTMIFGVNAAVFLLPVSGLFMSMIYPTLNSKGISCFHKSEHGSVAGIILFFTAVAAAIGPLMMGAISDLLGHVMYGFGLATIFAGLLFVGMLYNWIKNPAQSVLNELEESDYEGAAAATS